MPWDSIGDVYTGDVWGGDALNLAVKHLRLMIGPLPPGHELGVLDDSNLGVYCDFTPDQNFVRHCEDALAEMNDSGEWKSVIWDIEAELEAAAEDEPTAIEAPNELTKLQEKRPDSAPQEGQSLQEWLESLPKGGKIIGVDLAPRQPKK